MADKPKTTEERYREAMLSACRRFEEEDRGKIETRNGLAWAMLRDLRKALGIPISETMDELLKEYRALCNHVVLSHHMRCHTGMHGTYFEDCERQFCKQLRELESRMAENEATNLTARQRAKLGNTQ